MQALGVGVEIPARRVITLRNKNTGMEALLWLKIVHVDIK